MPLAFPTLRRPRCVSRCQTAHQTWWLHGMMGKILPNGHGFHGFHGYGPRDIISVAFNMLTMLILNWFKWNIMEIQVAANTCQYMLAEHDGVWFNSSPAPFNLIDPLGELGIHQLQAHSPNACQPMAVKQQERPQPSWPSCPSWPWRSWLDLGSLWFGMIWESQNIWKTSKILYLWDLMSMIKHQSCPQMSREKTWNHCCPYSRPVFLELRSPMLESWPEKSWTISVPSCRNRNRARWWYGIAREISILCMIPGSMLANDGPVINSTMFQPWFNHAIMPPHTIKGNQTSWIRHHSNINNSSEPPVEAPTFRQVTRTLQDTHQF